MTVPRPLYMANEALAFVLELAGLVLLGWWGFSRNVVLGLGAPLLAAVVWGIFAAPRARVRLPFAGVMAVKAAFYGAATAALWALGHPAAALVFAVVVVLNTALAEAGRQPRLTA